MCTDSYSAQWTEETVYEDMEKGIVRTDCSDDGRLYSKGRNKAAGE